MFEARSPSLSSGLDGRKPGWCVSTRKSEINACAGPVSDLAATTAKSATLLFVMYILALVFPEPIAAASACRRPEGGDVGAGVGLGHGEGDVADARSGDRGPEELFLLLAAA